MSAESIGREQAIANAKAEVRTTYGDVDFSEFQMKVVETAMEWRVEFDKTQSLADGESQHCSVWVDKGTGKGRLFKGR